jgi:hypothetical protein
MFRDGLPLLVRIAVGEGVFETFKKVVEPIERLRAIVAGKPFARSSGQSSAFVALVNPTLSTIRSGVGSVAMVHPTAGIAPAATLKRGVRPGVATAGLRFRSRTQ